MLQPWPARSCRRWCSTSWLPPPCSPAAGRWWEQALLSWIHLLLPGCAALQWTWVVAPAPQASHGGAGGCPVPPLLASLPAGPAQSPAPAAAQPANQAEQQQKQQQTSCSRFNTYHSIQSRCCVQGRAYANKQPGPRYITQGAAWGRGLVQCQYTIPLRLLHLPPPAVGSAACSAAACCCWLPVHHRTSGSCRRCWWLQTSPCHRRQWW